jgi:para-nitrobenzyl esterase
VTTTEVKLAAGRVRGIDEAGLTVFRGIPFAEPPIGPLRFAAPRRTAGWDGVREATEFGPPPPQAGFFGMDALVRDSDDWLTVNVWTPDPGAGSGLPVMVWIQGGAYGIGMSGLPEYDGARLARHGVVLVTFNYRVGVEGFAQIDGHPANRGLLDQVAALEWVRDNIHAFGGDPRRVTVFGESAGGGSVAALMAMPRAAGLFGRAIAQSVPGTFFTPELAADITAALGSTDLDPHDLSRAADELTARLGEFTGRWGLPAHRGIPFAPVVDGDVLPSTPWRALAEGAGRDVDLVVGHTRDEHRLFMVIDGTLGSVTADQAASASALFAPGPYGEDLEPEQRYERVHSDWLFRMPSLHLAEAQVAGGGRAHLYELTWEGTLGACHGLDVPLVFGNLTEGQPAMLIGGDPEAEEVSAQMRAAWTGFAATGDPGWPEYEPRRRLTRVFDRTSTVTGYPEEDSRLAWRDHRFDALPLSTAASTAALTERAR